MDVRRGVAGVFTDLKPSSPYPQTYAGYPDDMDDWECSQWYYYLYDNIMLAGKEQAVRWFNIDADSVSFWSDFHSCRYDCDWVNRIKEIGGKDLETGANFLSTTYCGTTETIEDIPKVSKDVVTAARVVPYVAVAAGIIYLESKTHFIRDAFK